MALTYKLPKSTAINKAHSIDRWRFIYIVHEFYRNIITSSL